MKEIKKYSSNNYCCPYCSDAQPMVLYVNSHYVSRLSGSRVSYWLRCPDCIMYPCGEYKGVRGWENYTDVAVKRADAVFSRICDYMSVRAEFIGV